MAPAWWNWHRPRSLTVPGVPTKPARTGSTRIYSGSAGSASRCACRPPRRPCEVRQGRCSCVVVWRGRPNDSCRTKRSISTSPHETCTLAGDPDACRGARLLTDDKGFALVVTLMVMSLLLALSLALTLTTMTETRIAAAYRRGVEARYAADAAVARAVLELSKESRWDEVLAGTLTSSFVDGAATGTRALPGGGSLNLTEATGAVRCGRTACSQADVV